MFWAASPTSLTWIRTLCDLYFLSYTWRTWLEPSFRGGKTYCPFLLVLIWNEDDIEAILSDYEGHSLHEFIDGNGPLRPIIDFDLPIETLNAITPKVMRKEPMYLFRMPLEMFV